MTCLRRYRPMHPPERLEEVLTGAFINRDFVNRKKKILDITRPAKPIDPYATAALWVLCGVLVGVAGWVAVNW